jgi:hypothetical protein
VGRLGLSRGFGEADNDSGMLILRPVLSDGAVEIVGRW